MSTAAFPLIDPGKVADVLRTRFGSRPLTFPAFHEDLGEWLPDLTGPEKLAAFWRLPERMQQTAWAALAWGHC